MNMVLLNLFNYWMNNNFNIYIYIYIYIFELAEDNLKMPIWKYSDKCDFEINDTKVIDYRVDLSNETPEGKIELLSFAKYMPYIMGLAFYNYELKKQRTYSRIYNF